MQLKKIGDMEFYAVHFSYSQSVTVFKLAVN